VTSTEGGLVLHIQDCQCTGVADMTEERKSIQVSERISDSIRFKKKGSGRVGNLVQRLREAGEKRGRSKHKFRLIIRLWDTCQGAVRRMTGEGE